MSRAAILLVTAAFLTVPLAGAGTAGAPSLPDVPLLPIDPSTDPPLSPDPTDPVAPPATTVAEAEGVTPALPGITPPPAVDALADANGPVCYQCHDGDSYWWANKHDPQADLPCEYCHSMGAHLNDGSLMGPYYVSTEAMRETRHFQEMLTVDPEADCTTCHVTTDGTYVMHPSKNLIVPGEADLQSGLDALRVRNDVSGTCGKCHADAAATFATSLHGTGAGTLAEYLQMEEQGTWDSPLSPLEAWQRTGAGAACSDCHMVPTNREPVNWKWWLDAAGSDVLGLAGTEILQVEARPYTQDESASAITLDLGHLPLWRSGGEALLAAGVTPTDASMDIESHDIVLPSELHWEEQADLCQRCHQREAANFKGNLWGPLMHPSADVHADIHYEKQIPCTACHGGVFHGNGPGHAATYDFEDIDPATYDPASDVVLTKATPIPLLPLEIPGTGPKTVPLHPDAVEPLRCEDCHMVDGPTDMLAGAWNDQGQPKEWAEEKAVLRVATGRVTIGNAHDTVDCAVCHAQWATPYQVEMGEDSDTVTLWLGEPGRLAGGVTEPAMGADAVVLGTPRFFLGRDADGRVVPYTYTEAGLEQAKAHTREHIPFGTGSEACVRCHSDPFQFGAQPQDLPLAWNLQSTDTGRPLVGPDTFTEIGKAHVESSRANAPETCVDCHVGSLPNGDPPKNQGHLANVTTCEECHGHGPVLYNALAEPEDPAYEEVRCDACHDYGTLRIHDPDPPMEEMTQREQVMQGVSDIQGAIGDPTDPTVNLDTVDVVTRELTGYEVVRISGLLLQKNPSNLGMALRALDHAQKQAGAPAEPVVVVPGLLPLDVLELVGPTGLSESCVAEECHPTYVQQDVDPESSEAQDHGHDAGVVSFDPGSGNDCLLCHPDHALCVVCHGGLGVGGEGRITTDHGIAYPDGMKTTGGA